jgi:hypothetical protein
MSLEQRMRAAVEAGQREHVMQLTLGPGGELLATVASVDQGGDLARFIIVDDVMCCVWACTMGKVALWPIDRSGKGC